MSTRVGAEMGSVRAEMGSVGAEMGSGRPSARRPKETVGAP